MSERIPRRTFVATATTILAASPAAIYVGRQSAGIATNQEKNPLDRDMVFEYVKFAHTDLEKTTTLVDTEPRLIRSTWDWGNGDFESGLGAAAHMGFKPMANLLLERGAPIDLFACAMLGKLDVVKATLTAFPNLIHVPGPHGIPLISHARAGGIDAEPVVEYLERSLGEEPGISDGKELTDQEIDKFAGKYQAEVNERNRTFTIFGHRSRLYFKTDDGRSEQRLHRQEPETFSIPGANIFVEFETEDTGEVYMTIKQGSRTVRARRVE